jgi:membrane protein
LLALVKRLATMARKVVLGLHKHHAFDHAATMAFYFFLGTIPLLVLVGLLVGHLVEIEGVTTLATPLYRLLPGVTATLIRTELHDIAQAEATSIAPVGILGFLWLTSNGFHNLMDVFELLIGARPRSWLRQRAVAIAWVIVVLVITCFSVWFLLVTTGWAANIRDPRHVPVAFQKLRDGMAAGWTAAGVMFMFIGVTTCGLAAFYRFAVVHPRTVRRRVWTGAFVAIILWVLVSLAFGAYVGSIAHYSVFYGSLATVAVTLLWFYLTSLSFLVGAEINAQLEGAREALMSTPAL